MNRRTEIILAIIGIVLACCALIFGDNLFQQVTGRSFFQLIMQEFIPSSRITPKETATAPRQTEATILVPATTEWQNTDVQLSPGDKVIMSARGEWSHGYQGDTASTPFYDADGYDKFDSTVYLPSSKVGSLIGRIGNGTLFFVGSELEFISAENGVLYLGINDTPGSYARENNSGELTVMIIVIESQ